jgi:histidine triad (HIT) family protein
MNDCIFCKIAKQEIPKEFLYEDDDVMVFPDIHPVRPVHLLVIPKKHVNELIAVEDATLFPKLFSVVQTMVKKEGLADKGYRVTINGGGAQLINHLHIHVTGPLKNTAKL